jgi:hypothetical protein
MHEMASESGGGTSERASGCCEVEGDASGSCEVGGVCGGTEPERMGENGRCEGAVKDFVDTLGSGRLGLMGGVKEFAGGWEGCRGLADDPSLGVSGDDKAGDGCFRLSGTSEGGSADWTTCRVLVRSTAIPTLLEVRDGPCAWATC